MTTMCSDIETIAQTIWEATLGSPIALGGQDSLVEESQVTCLVHLHGAFQGAVMIQCPNTLGAKLTASMLQGPTLPSTEDVIDALGELTNMLAGNVKPLLATPSSISLPTVAFGPRFELGVSGTTVLARVPFICDGQPLVVTILERSDKGGVGEQGRPA